MEKSVTLHYAMICLLGMGILMLGSGWTVFYCGLLPGIIATAIGVLGIPHTRTIEAYTRCNFLFAPMKTFGFINHLLMLLLGATAIVDGVAAYILYLEKDGLLVGDAAPQQGLVITCMVASTVAFIVGFWAKFALHPVVNRAFLDATLAAVTMYSVAADRGRGSAPGGGNDSGGRSNDDDLNFGGRGSEEREPEATIRSDQKSYLVPQVLVCLPQVEHPDPADLRGSTAGSNTPSVASRGGGGGSIHGIKDDISVSSSSRYQPQQPQNPISLQTPATVSPPPSTSGHLGGSVTESMAHSRVGSDEDLAALLGGSTRSVNTSDPPPSGYVLDDVNF